MTKKGYVYILSNPRKTVLYTGVTGNLGKQVFAHKNKIAEGFTRSYDCNDLVYYEIKDSLEKAQVREKEIQSECRLGKEALIKRFNPEWKDLSDELLAIKKR
ncbi:GIY-YIG nuclease family protein [Kangiella koreensis]|uniref:Excinuclease ABC C subunit domain protein n=1 Tax=Kangiella koreensis (strain DSM 16069 / JCM 12317 / KCTC 12182 / SW-125) TaxID=523791 RepID=C7R9N2_KANKD|nr:GIY-YIG nuclease family protein [Kangiella koreensis]ACV26123.1 Excinuclease ABC C subunit domain protein [Kangiella koreensis DSM 16069]